MADERTISKGLDPDSAWPMPEAFRASLNPEDKKAYEQLIRNNSEQADLATRVRSPFARTNPREMMRSKAMITVKSLRNASIHGELTVDQLEQLAESYALIGRYDLAAETTVRPEARKVYEDYWKAVFADDDEVCPHSRHHFVRDRIWSIREGREVPLIACNACGHLNATQKGHDALHEQIAGAKAHQGKTKGMSIGQAQAFHQNSVKKNNQRF